jgi:GntR family transcriptional repressor for pyruvate dehydrogenase complex
MGEPVSIDRRAWMTVLDHIESDLLDGTLAPGDHLPSERQLASNLGVGRSSVREALRVLEVLGLVRTQVGSGPGAGAIIIATPGGGMSALMRLQVAASGFPVTDVVKTRLILEGAVVDELATRADGDLSGGAPLAADNLRSATQLLDAMDESGLTPGEFLALDQQFHLALAEATGNEVVAAMMAGLRSSIEGYVTAGSEAIDNWRGTAARLRREHRGIVAAISAGDALDARARIHNHISGYYAETHLGE